MNNLSTNTKHQRRNQKRVKKIAIASVSTYYSFFIPQGKVSKKALEALSEIGLTNENRLANKEQFQKIIKQFYDTQKEVLVSRSYYGGIAIWNVSYQDPENPEKRKIVAAAWESWRDYCSHQNVRHNIKMFKELKESMNK